MAGPHRTTGQGAALLPAPAQPGCLKIRGKRNTFKERTAGVGPDFQVVGGEGRLCRSRGPGRSWTTEGGAIMTDDEQGAPGTSRTAIGLTGSKERLQTTAGGTFWRLIRR
jgi:hypothetical protein